MSSASALTLRPIPHGWGVYLTDGRQLARFRGPGARMRAIRYLLGIAGGGRGKRR